MTDPKKDTINPAPVINPTRPDSDHRAATDKDSDKQSDRPREGKADAPKR